MCKHKIIDIKNHTRWLVPQEPRCGVCVRGTPQQMLGGVAERPGEQRKPAPGRTSMPGLQPEHSRRRRCDTLPATA
ncbi:hypothetical protein E2C01_058539 [Portunus trituberculatus]|uniref:Uncharacterized protein n=1 Tax=Portunus trituberculatus TaxID=210409 RepID=A0A5B7H2Z3_PORTR|nr:hypothetical protein [Portunus trituberculatus]